LENSDNFDIGAVEITAMKTEHLEQVFEIERGSFSSPWSYKELLREITENNMAVYIVALYEGNVVGYAGLWHIITEGHITNVAVKEEYRGRGVGRLIMRRLIEAARERAMTGVTLEVRVSNQNAQRMYTSLGFKPEGFRKAYYDDTKEDAVIMWKYM
jgi:ribosomal-protein-alanine N-acetyltransferase